MNCLVLHIGVCLLIASAFCEDGDISEEELSVSRPTLIWRPTDSNPIIVKADKGYQIIVEATQFDVDGESGDYVTVKSISEDGEDSDELMFSYTVSGKPNYLYNNNKLQADYVGTNASNSFSIQFKITGEALTTTPEPSSTTTTEAMPTAAPDESNTLSVYIYGRPAANFGSSEINSLREAIAAMGAEYCSVQNCPLNGSITLNNVKIENLERCPMLWENYENCVNLTFALPIVKLEDPDENVLWAGYQLNESHLKIMWETYAAKYLNKIDMAPYVVPNVKSIFTVRLIVICLVIVSLVILILVLRHVIRRISKRRKTYSDTISIMGQPSTRNSDSSLTPHYLSELPPLFSNDFPIYPEQRTHKNFSDFNNDFTDDIDPTTLPSSVPGKLNISGTDPDELEDAEA